jgi:hypothetical protein
MSWAISPVNHGQRPAYFELLAATVEQLGATRSVLRAVVTLADDAPTITDQQLRDRLLALAERARLAQRAIVEDSGGVTVPSIDPGRPPVERVRPRALPGLPAAGRFQSCA